MKIIQFEQTGPYRLRVWFRDGSVRDADFGPFLQSSHNVLIRQFLDHERFATVHLDEFGTLVWGDNDMDIDPASIYENEFLPRELALK